MSDKLREAFGLKKKTEPRVKTVKELQKEYEEIDSRMEHNKRERTQLSQTINEQKKQLARLQELIDNNNQLNMFPNG